MSSLYVRALTMIDDSHDEHGMACSGSERRGSYQGIQWSVGTRRTVPVVIVDHLLQATDQRLTTSLFTPAVPLLTPDQAQCCPDCCYGGRGTEKHGNTAHRPQQRFGTALPPYNKEASAVDGQAPIVWVGPAAGCATRFEPRPKSTFWIVREKASICWDTSIDRPRLPSQRHGDERNHHACGNLTSSKWTNESLTPERLALCARQPPAFPGCAHSRHRVTTDSSVDLMHP